MATDSPTEASGAETASTSEPGGAPGAVDGTGGLSEKQLDVLRAIHEHPDAAQRELGERLGVSPSTVSTRLSEVPGFEWEDRWAFVRRLFGGATDGGQLARADDDLRERLDALEERLDGLGSGAPPPGAPDSPFEPELAHKVVHACIESERVSEDEELAVLRTLMTGTASGQPDQ